MKKNIFLFVALTSILIVGCDIIDFPVIEYGTYRDDLYGPAPSFAPLSGPTQRVLVEDFTGHDCGNCPAAHVVAKEILANHEDEVALVAVHAGSLAEPFGQFPEDWRTPEGEYYLLTQIGTDLLPTGRVNRRNGASQDTSFETWATQTDEELTETPKVGMQMQAEYIQDNQHLNVHVNSQWFSAASGDYKLVILITQDSIIAPQLNYDADPEFIPDYVHMHMLRGTVTGATGLTAASNPAVGYTSTNSYTIDWNSEWVAEHCEIIAFITEGDNGEVLNVVKQKLIE